MQRVRVVYHGISHESICLYTHKPLGECAYQENTSDKWDIPWYPMRKCFINILYHATENTVANTINAARNGKAEFNTVKDTMAFLFFCSLAVFPIKKVKSP